MMFGDGPNDMEIFDYVGLKIAMGNAVLNSKKSRFCNKNSRRDGILYAGGTRFGRKTISQVDLSTVEGQLRQLKQIMVT